MGLYVEFDVIFEKLYKFQSFDLLEEFTVPIYIANFCKTLKKTLHTIRKEPIFLVDFGKLTFYYVLQSLLKYFCRPYNMCINLSK